MRFLAQQAEGSHHTQVVQIGIDRTVDGVLTEQAGEALLADTEKLSQLGSTEVGRDLLRLLLHAQLKEPHELGVVLKVGITLTLDVDGEYLLGNKGTAPELDISLQLFGQVE